MLGLGDTFYVNGIVVGRRQCHCPTCKEGGWHDHGYVEMAERVRAGDEWEAIERVEGKALKKLKRCEKVRWISGPFVYFEEERRKGIISEGVRLLEQLRALWHRTCAEPESDWIVTEDEVVHIQRQRTRPDDEDTDNDFVVIVRGKGKGE